MELEDSLLLDSGTWITGLSTVMGQSESDSFFDRQPSTEDVTMEKPIMEIAMSMATYMYMHLPGLL